MEEQNLKIDMLETVKKYINLIRDDNNHRYLSWDNCYFTFKDSSDTDYLSLHLAFYLASWGMYRGSSGLLWKDYRAHKKAVEIILDNSSLRKDIITVGDIDLILKIKDQLSDTYNNLMFFDAKKGINKTVTPTDTLISKILLGTLGCLPAFDRYFNKGCHEMSRIKFNKIQLAELINHTEKNIDTIKECQNYIRDTIGKNYPTMKIIDMYYWQKGYDMQNLKKE